MATPKEQRQQLAAQRQARNELRGLDGAALLQQYDGLIAHRAICNTPNCGKHWLATATRDEIAQRLAGASAAVTA